NLEVLKLLQKSYFEKVKMIYIDPPYNTGKDFVYKDNFNDNLKNYLEVTGQVGEEGEKLSTNSDQSGRYHSNWLNMMYPRLKLARNLLKDDGVIFISIDDNEVTNLKKICDEIFGENNIINNRLFVNHIPNGTNKGYIARAHEYILAYSKSIDKLKTFKRWGEPIVSEERCTNTPTDKNPTSTIKFKKGLRFEGTNKEINGIIGNKEPIEIIGQMKFKNGYLDEDVELKSSWRNKSQILEYLKDGVAYDENGQEVFEIYFTIDGKPKYRKKLTSYSPKSVQQFKNYEFEKDFLDLSFENPKPVSLIEFLIKLICNNDDMVLDFFSGSGTTGNAIIKINSEYNSFIRYILVQLPEDLDKSKNNIDGKAATFIKNMINKLDNLNKPHILTEIGKVRLDRAGEKIKQDFLRNNENLKLGQEQKEFKTDIGFKVFKLDSSNIKAWDSEYAKDNIQQSLLDSISNIKEDRTEHDLLFELLLKQGLDLTTPIAETKVNAKVIYNIGAGALYVSLSDNITVDVAEKIIEENKIYKSPRITVIFKDNGFKNDVDKTNVIQTLKVAGISDIKSI
nr:site-specific DNA-methyltransferase [Aliarcobacter sp.]